MLVKDLYQIELNLKELAYALANNFSKYKITVFSNDYRNSFYLVDKNDCNLCSRDGTTYLYQQKGLINYGLITDYYYDCSKNSFIRYIKNNFYRIYDFHTLIRIISGYINSRENKIIGIVVDDSLFRAMLISLRKKISAYIETNSFPTDLIDLYPIYKQMFSKFKFYIAYYEYEAFKMFYKNFSIGIGYDFDVLFPYCENNNTFVFKRCMEFIQKQAERLFKKQLNHTRFLTIDSYRFNEIKQINLTITLVFKMNRLDEIIKTCIASYLQECL